MYDYLPLQIIIAFTLDLLIGDPKWLPHPIRIIGRSIDVLERILRKAFESERTAGIFLAGIIVVGTYLFTYGIIFIFGQFGKVCEIAAGTVFIFYSLSTRDLLKETKSVLSKLESGDIVQARRNLSKIVGRDTHDLNEQQIIRACVETTAESSVDGIIAPLFYALFGGPVLVMVYKAISTLDSMVGYKNTRYIDLGRASARLDDLVNYVPARVAAVILPMSSYICGADYKNSISVIRRDGGKHPSPNSGIPEAAIAGALGIRLGGPSKYEGVVSNKPLIGVPDNEIVPDNINQAAKIVFVAAVLSVTLGIASYLIVNYLLYFSNDISQIINNFFSTKTYYKFAIIN